MKAFAFSIGIFTLLILVIFLNYHYINFTCNHLRDIIDTVTNIDDSNIQFKINEFENYFDNQKKYIGLSVEYSKIENTDSLITALKSYYATGNNSEFSKTLELLKDSIEELSRLEKISIDNIM